ncbi:mitochondrial inner membrane protein OXA1-like [Vigna umbellata]|uniref:mitochondrial inner membrane protein OXA1-like n=1 Tax=Vigna umbellata TaxID=87088 RepID=UPI001F5F03A4|nr:mitochondrial inner membrane protein OXA1-like [Vigna umbellata]XP_047155159.1 mitochondrial inner membrane protein OXA1-like [Vigna umbellata]
MAHRRCLLIRGNLMNQKCHPSFSYVLHSDEEKHESTGERSSSAGISNFFQRRMFGNSVDGSMWCFAYSEHRMSSNRFLSPSSGYNLYRHMSTTNQGSDKIEIMTDIADVLKNNTMEAVNSQAPILKEVAIASADSVLPVKALQYIIDAMHSYTGLNWWAAIVITTLLIRSATVPLLINQLKATSKLTLMRPHMEKIKEEMEDKAMDPIAVAEGQKKMKMLFKEYGASPFTPLKGLFIQGPVFISFFLAIRNMAEKMPSFKDGGAYWFVDLTTPDALYILPVLTALTFLITVECNMQEGMEGNPAAGTMKKVSRVLAVLTVPFTMGFPKAIFCYWITSNLFSLGYGLVLKAPGVKKALGIPIIPEAAATSGAQSPSSIFPALKQATAARIAPKSLPVEPSKHITNTSSDVNQRLNRLEKQVKRRKKNKK